MLIKILTCILALILVFAPVMAADDSSISLDQWDVVETIPIGEKLLVEMKDGKRVKGVMAAVSSDSVSVRDTGTDAGKTIALKRDEIKRIYRLVGRSRGKSALIGTGVGAAIGGGIGLILYLPNRDDIVGGVVPAFATVGAGFGAAIGAALGKGQKRVLVYQAG
jgi:hypothetical protein